MSDTPSIAIIDYGSGNLHSVSKALEHLGLSCAVTSDAVEIGSARGVILPGVGAFGDAMTELERRGIAGVARDRGIEARDGGRPFLGVCVGMQILVDDGEEDPGVPGLGVVKGSCPRLRRGEGLKIPHMGWNGLETRPGCPLFEGLPERPWVYFVHSYHVVPASDSCVAAWTDHGGRVAAVLHSGNLFATQFHPEKSQATGLRLLRNFGDLVARTAA